MNTRKDRYAVRISESSYIEMQEQALRDGAKQGIAVALVSLEKAFGWRKVRLERVYSVVDELLHLPQIFGHDVTADDAITSCGKHMALMWISWTCRWTHGKGVNND